MAELPNCQTLLLEQVEGVLHVTLNRPDSRNAMSLAMVEELRAVLRAVRHDQGVRALVLRGGGGHFCAGGDLKDMAEARSRLADEGPAVLERLNAAFGALCQAFDRTPLATVAVLQGTVMGGGFGLACVADLALAGRSVRFRLPETSLGVVPAQIAPFEISKKKPSLVVSTQLSTKTPSTLPTSYHTPLACGLSMIRLSRQTTR